MNKAVMFISEPRVFLLQAVQGRQYDLPAGVCKEKLAMHWGGSSRSLKGVAAAAAMALNLYSDWMDTVGTMDNTCAQ